MASKTVTIRLTDKAYALLTQQADADMDTPTGYATRVLVDNLLAIRNGGENGTVHDETELEGQL